MSIYHVLASTVELNPVPAFGSGVRLEISGKGMDLTTIDFTIVNVDDMPPGNVGYRLYAKPDYPDLMFDSRTAILVEGETPPEVTGRLFDEYGTVLAENIPLHVIVWKP